MMIANTASLKAIARLGSLHRAACLSADASGAVPVDRRWSRSLAPAGPSPLSLPIEPVGRPVTAVRMGAAIPSFADNAAPGQPVIRVGGRRIAGVLLPALMACPLLL
jgi:hypothetical protein